MPDETTAPEALQTDPKVIEVEPRKPVISDIKFFVDAWDKHNATFSNLLNQSCLIDGIEAKWPLDEMEAEIEARGNPLSKYLFAEHAKIEQKFKEALSFIIPKLVQGE